MTDDDRQNTQEDATAAAGAGEAGAQADRMRGEARAAEVREEVAITDARRAEEEAAKQHEDVEAAEREEEKLSRKERRAREEAERAKQEADRSREQAEQAESMRREAAERPHAPHAEDLAAAGAEVPAEVAQPMTQRPEVLAGAAFAGAFVAARVLRRIFD